MSALRWLALSTTLLLACGEEDRKTISESGTQPTGPLGGTNGGVAGAAGSAGGGGHGAPGDPAPHESIVGFVLDPNLSWQGYTAGSDELGVVTLNDYYDPTGSRGIRALLVTEGQADCGPCVAEAADIQSNQTRWKQLGIEVMQLVVSDIQGNPATSSTAYAWKERIKASWAVGVDPNFTFSEVGSNPYPIQIIIDPRTLTILHRIEGYRETLPELEALAEKNQ